MGDFNPPQEPLDTFSGRIFAVTIQLEQMKSFADTDIKNEIQKFTDLTTAFDLSVEMLGESKVVMEKSSQLFLANANAQIDRLKRNLKHNN